VVNRHLFRSLALFSGIVILGSTIPDIFRFIEGKEWLGHSALIPVLILGFIFLAFGVRQFAKFILRKW
jgi:hypothetical protein